MHYQPDPLARAAAEDLMERLGQSPRWQDHFGQPGKWRTGSGKMFGVLVVHLPDGNRAYLAAFSGKLADRTCHSGFVPPVYDLLDEANFYRDQERRLNQLTLALNDLRDGEAYRHARKEMERTEQLGNAALERLKSENRQAKLRRDRIRTDHGGPVPSALVDELRRESVERSYALKHLRMEVKDNVKHKKKILDEYNLAIAELTDRRAALSAKLQHRIFSHYRFRDAVGRERDANDIFAATALRYPPAGAGDCAAPKLFQYAFLRQLPPLTFAEFWWGPPPSSSLRRHRQYYPACRGKCEPILGHMLGKSEVEPNPLLENPATGKEIRILYEDDDLLLVSKPENFLSVPGRHTSDSVQQRLRSRYPAATGPLLVHRLDMSTSGILLAAKTKHVHQLLQRQFFRRTVTKRYVAIVSGNLTIDEGTIDLPLRGDLYDRPRQIVCSTHGKPARSRYRVVATEKGQSLLHFWPVTGRTHQLRVHAAHFDGLNAPIVGDDLYGTPADRLYLHAAEISFRHPVKLEPMTISDPPPFDL
jgi:tRNA pseudouridine32 synthase/23S rRNA pseudouridine746 synthase